jgi:protoporphyrinogen oxidase
VISRAIVGGGLLGMALAHRLARSGESVTIYEAAETLGGLAAPWRLGPVEWDRHYHVILSSDAALRALLRELDLEREIRWKRTRTGFFSEGRLHSVSNAREFLETPLFGWMGKVRLAATVLVAAHGRDRGALERISAASWVRRWSGAKTADAFWNPLLRSKLGSAAADASAAFLGATIRRMYAARRTGLAEEFGYVPGGYARILARFSELLDSMGVRIRCGEPVTGVRADAGGLRLRLALAEEFADRAVLTVAPALAARMAGAWTDAERESFDSVPYLGVICASVLLRRRLSDFYITNLTDPGFPFAGVIEMTALVDPDDLGGHALVYLPRYADSRDAAAFAVDDAEVERRCLAGLRRIHPELSPSDVAAFRVSRARYVTPLSTVAHPRGLERTATSIPGVELVCSAHLKDATLNVNETIELARTVPLAGVAA